MNVPVQQLYTRTYYIGVIRAVPGLYPQLYRLVLGKLRFVRVVPGTIFRAHSMLVT